MARAEKEEMKSIKVTASTHSQLSILSAVFGKTIAEIIADMLTDNYPEMIEETDRMLERLTSLKEKADAKREKQK